MGSALPLLRQKYLVLFIFQSSISIPIQGLQYCIAIQNSKTCPSLQSTCTDYVGISDRVTKEIQISRVSNKNVSANQSKETQLYGIIYSRKFQHLLHCDEDI